MPGVVDGCGYCCAGRSDEEDATVPIATPEIYNQMLDKAKSGRVRLPGDQRHQHGDAERRPARVRRGGERRHRADLHRRRGVPVRHPRQGHGHRRGRRSPSSRTSSPEVPGQHRAAHRPLPEGQARRLRPPADRDQPGARRRAARTRCSSRTCGTARPSSWRRTSRSPPSCSTQAAKAKIILEVEIGVVGGEEDGVANDINEKLYTAPRRLRAHRRGARRRREGPLPAGRHVRQRARRLQAGQRQAPPGDPQAGPGGRRGQARAAAPAPSRSTWSSTAAPARCSRRSTRRWTTAW